MPAGYAAIINTIAGGVNGYLDGAAQNDTRKQILGAYQNLPQVPDLEGEYMSGYQKQLQFTPQALAMDRGLRAQYLPQDLQQAAQLYRQYLPQFANANLRALRRVDPQFVDGRNQLYHAVSQELGYGRELDPKFREQLTNYLRGAQAARGNVLGAAPVAAEALYQGQAGQRLQQQRMQNMLDFLRAPGPEDKFAGLAGGGAGALGSAMAAASNPGYSYIEGPRGWGDVYMKAAQTEFENESTQALAKARATAAAPPEVNPWMTSFAAGLSALGGSLGSMGGGSGGGGGRR